MPSPVALDQYRNLPIYQCPPGKRPSEFVQEAFGGAASIAASDQSYDPSCPELPPLATDVTLLGWIRLSGNEEPRHCLVIKK